VATFRPDFSGPDCFSAGVGITDLDRHGSQLQEKRCTKRANGAGPGLPPDNTSKDNTLEEDAGSPPGRMGRSGYPALIPG